MHPERHLPLSSFLLECREEENILRFSLFFFRVFKLEGLDLHQVVCVCVCVCVYAPARACPCARARLTAEIERLILGGIRMYGCMFLNGFEISSMCGHFIV